MEVSWGLTEFLGDVKEPLEATGRWYREVTQARWYGASGRWHGASGRWYGASGRSHGAWRGDTGPQRGQLSPWGNIWGLREVNTGSQGNHMEVPRSWLERITREKPSLIFQILYFYIFNNISCSRGPILNFFVIQHLHQISKTVMKTASFHDSLFGRYSLCKTPTHEWK